jgi:hypothetical protein
VIDADALAEFTSLTPYGAKMLLAQSPDRVEALILQKAEEGLRMIEWWLNQYHPFS